MNAYEKRKDIREKASKLANQKRREINMLRKDCAERAYVEAFRMLQGRDPLVIPKESAARLQMSARMMYAKLHQLDMQGDEDDR